VEKRSFFGRRVFLALVADACGWSDHVALIQPLWEGTVKKIALAVVLTVTALSLGGCFVGKGKAPAPVATRG